MTYTEATRPIPDRRISLSRVQLPREIHALDSLLCRAMRMIQGYVITALDDDEFSVEDVREYMQSYDAQAEFLGTALEDSNIPRIFDYALYVEKTRRFEHDHPRDESFFPMIAESLVASAGFHGAKCVCELPADCCPIPK